MSSKIPLRELAVVWDKATHLYDEGNLLQAAEEFEKIANDHTAKISFNLGCIYMKLKESQKSLQKFQSAVRKDAHFVAAYAMMGAIYLEFNMYDIAIKCYEAATQLIGNNKYINYRPLGLNLILYLTEVLHNQAVAESNLDNWKQVEILINMAISAQQEHKFNNKLQSSLQAVQQKQYFKYFPLETGIFYPPKWMTENLRNIDYLGDSKVISINSNPFNMNDVISGVKSKPQPDQVWPTLEELEEEKEHPFLSILALMTLDTTATVKSDVDDLKLNQVEGKRPPPEGKPTRPLPKLPARPPARPPTRPPPPIRNRKFAINNLQQQGTNHDVKCQDNTNNFISTEEHGAFYSDAPVSTAI